jgi:hypothetical protein
MAMVILAALVAAALVAARAGVPPEVRSRARAKPGVWADQDHCG